METIRLEHNDRAARKAAQPKYDNGERRPHPDDASDIDPPDSAFEPLEGESMADVLRRVGAPARANKRVWQAMAAKTERDAPDYRARLEAAKLVRDTVEGTPDKAKPAKPKDAGAPSPGLLIARDGKGAKGKV